MPAEGAGRKPAGYFGRRRLPDPGHAEGPGPPAWAPNRTHIGRVHRLLERYSPRLSVRVLSSLADGQESLHAIDALLVELDAEPDEVHLIAGTSGFRITYRLPNGRKLIAALG